MFRIDRVLETVVIEHPDREDVLAIVPHGQDEPAVVDVRDDDVTESEDRQVRSDVQRVGDR